MIKLPESIQKSLFDLVYAERSIAYLEVESTGEIVALGGEMTLFGLEHVQPGSQVEDHFDFMIDLFATATLPLDLPIMEMPSGLPADVHIFSDNEVIYVLLLSAQEKQQQRQRFRQNVNDLNLSRHRQSKILNQYLGKEVVERLELGLENVEFGGERKNLTIMFADIRGFTSYSERSNPENIFKSLNSYLDAMIPVILEHQGVLDKIIGDEVMAIFGMLDESSAPDDAFTAAIHMLAAVERVNIQRAKNNETQLGVGIGIASGPVSLGVLGSSDRKSITVIGNHVNLAARLQGTAKARHMVLDTDTYKALSGYRKLFKKKEMELKGYSRVQKAYQLGLFDLPGVEEQLYPSKTNLNLP